MKKVISILTIILFGSFLLIIQLSALNVYAQEEELLEEGEFLLEEELGFEEEFELEEDLEFEEELVIDEAPPEEEVLVEEAPAAEEIIVEEVPEEAPPVEEIAVEEVPVEEAPLVEELIVEEVPVEEAPLVEELIVEEVPVEEAPLVEELTVEEVPLMEEAAIEELPFEEVTEVTEVVTPPMVESVLSPEEEAAMEARPVSPVPSPSALSDDEMMAEPPPGLAGMPPLPTVTARAAPRSTQIPQPVPGAVVKMLPPVLSATIAHTVAEGEDLHWLAARYYGNARLWKKIYEANYNKISNPNSLTVGQSLQIPSL
jgi:nucleoid-associated protein YgaU